MDVPSHLHLKAVLVEQHCDQHGSYMAVAPSGGQAIECPVCFESKMTQIAENSVSKIVRTMREAKEQVLYDCIGIPKKFKDETLESYRVLSDEHAVNRKNALREAREFADIFSADYGRSLVYFGNPGCGKSHLAAGVAKAVFAHGFTTKFVSLLGMLNGIKATFGQHSHLSYDAVIQSYVTPDLLVIDDIGVKFETDSDRTLIYDVINQRYEGEKSIVITSNLDIDELISSLGSRVISRLQDHDGVFFPCDWSSYRVSGGAQ